MGPEGGKSSTGGSGGILLAQTPEPEGGQDTAGPRPESRGLRRLEMISAMVTRHIYFADCILVVAPAVGVHSQLLFSFCILYMYIMIALRSESGRVECGL